KRRDGMRDTYARLCPEGCILVKSRSITPQQELDNPLLEHSEGFELTLQAITDKRVTALVGVNDMVAYGIADAVCSLGYSIPTDYSIAGFDNNFPSGLASVSLTTVEHCIEDKGHNAFDILHGKMGKNSVSDSSKNFITRVEYRQHLVIRNSTAAPRA
ncbi:MAG: substrate-binding domain-containing protein, partial [Angelakisella sp.]